jgi:RimJ/RimL family protein N-acetyltransferase
VWPATFELIYAGRVLKPSYPIRTDRLILRPFTPADQDALHAIQSLPEVSRYLYWGPRDAEQVREVLETRMGQSALLEEGQALSLAVELASTGELIGDGVLFWHSRLHRGGEIGYVFHPAHHGRGYATEVGQALLKLGFDGLNLRRITGRLDGRNEASARVLERLGMRREAHLVENEMVKGEWTDELVYAILQREWRARH